jgi:hypothetical protein
MGQLAGEPFRAGDSLTLSGRATQKMSLFVHVAIGRNIYRSTVSFRTLGLSGKRVLTIGVKNGRPVLRLKGRVVPATVKRLG